MLLVFLFFFLVAAAVAAVFFSFLLVSPAIEFQVHWSLARLPLGWISVGLDQKPDCCNYDYAIMIELVAGGFGFNRNKIYLRLSLPVASPITFFAAN